MKFFIVFLALVSSGLNIPLDAFPGQVMVIRHAEKPSSGDSLSIKGKERAAALAPFFLETPELLIYGPPSEIYAMAPSKADTSERPIDTVQPLADLLKLNIKSAFVIDDYKRMVDEIKTNPLYTGKNILICWEHKFIPEIVRAFGAFQTPARWQNEVYDRVWIINFGPSGQVSFKNIPQRLMYGDSAN